MRLKYESIRLERVNDGYMITVDDVYLGFRPARIVHDLELSLSPFQCYVELDNGLRLYATRELTITQPAVKEWAGEELRYVTAG